MLAEKAMAEEQAKISKHGSFILQYQEADIIPEELLKKEAVRTHVVCLSLCLSFLPCVYVYVDMNLPTLSVRRGRVLCLVSTARHVELIQC